MLSTQSKNSESVTLINYVEQVSHCPNSELVTVIAHSKLTSCDSLVKIAQNQRHIVSLVRSSALRDLGLGLVLMLAMCLPMLILYALASLGPFLIRDWHIDAGWLGYATLGCFTLAALLSPFAGYLVERLGTRLALSLLFFAGLAVGPPIFGVTISHSNGYRFAWDFLFGILLVGCVMTFMLIKKRQR